MERPFNIVSLFFHAAEKYSEKTAIIDRNGHKISFSALAAGVRQTATHFERNGIQKGNRVLLFVPMGIDLYRNILALLYVGATIVFVDQWSKIDRLNICCHIADCHAFVGGWRAHLLRFFAKGIRQIPVKLGLSYSRENNAEMCPTHRDDTALITFTTGSTGTPKAALRTHGFLHEQFKALEDEIVAQPSDVDMSVLPIILLINLAIGSTSVIADFNPSKPTKIQPQKIVKQLQENGITRLVTSPYFVNRLAEYVSTNKTALPHLGNIFTGGAPVFPREAKLYKKAFPNKRVCILYGSTEAEPISAISASQLVGTSYFDLRQGLSVGRIFHRAQVAIIPVTKKSLFDISIEEFGRIQLPEGSWGEIVVAGPHVLTQYYQNEQALRASKICINGVYWHRTGDSGYVLDGQLFLTGRCQTLIPYNGHWISPFVFENYIQTISGVEMGTILSNSEVITAFIELAKDSPSVRKNIITELQKLPFKVANIKFQPLPRDPRHHSKIAYRKLAFVD